MTSRRRYIDFTYHTNEYLCQVAGVHKVRTKPYCPQGNPVELFIRILLKMVRTLQNQGKSCWHDDEIPLVHTHNCTRNEVTGFTPYKIMFETKPNLTYKFILLLSCKYRGVNIDHTLIMYLNSCLKESYRKAMEKKWKYSSARPLVRYVRIRKTQKILDKSELTVHVVTKAGVLLVHIVKPKMGIILWGHYKGACCFCVGTCPWKRCQPVQKANATHAGNPCKPSGRGREWIRWRK